MVIIQDLPKNTSLEEKNFTSTGMFQVGSGLTAKESKINTFLDYLYTYPPKFKVKWNSLDELSDDLFLKTNYGVLQHSFPFLDFVEDFVFQQTPTLNIDDSYSKSDFINGYLNKRSSSNFYTKETNAIQTALAAVPVFVVLNGYNEIVLSKPETTIQSQTFTSYFKQTLYEQCGAFDPLVEKVPQLGLFFLNRKDAESYLHEVSKTDIDGTKILGLSIHCVGLDSAYRITREHHPGIDFRFVPNLKDVQGLLKDQVGIVDMLFDDNQHQLRFRRRSVNLFPSLGSLGLRLSPTNSFLQGNEYFKGVPLYIVQTSTQPRNLLLESGHQALARVDSFYGKFMQNLDYAVGLGHNWIMQGSVKHDGANLDGYTNYIFLNQPDAEKFIKKHGRKIARYKGSRSSNIEFAVRRPKICVSNLEDILEWWEESLQNPEKKFLGNQTFFVPASETIQEIQTLQEQYQQTRPLQIQQTLNVKYQNFKSFLGLFFGVGYF
jgi:hypothetical protein